MQTHRPHFWIFLLLTLAVLLGLSGISPLPLAFALPVLGLVAVCGVRLKTGNWLKLDWPLYGWTAALCGLGVASTLWSITPDESFERSLKVSALILFSLPLLDVIRAAPASALQAGRLFIPVATIIAGLTPLLGLYFQQPVEHLIINFINSDPLTVKWGSLFNKNVSIFIMALPLALLLSHKARTYSLSLVLLLMTAALACVTESQAAQLALIAIPLIWGVLVILPGAGIPLGFGLIAIVLLLMPWISPIAFDTFAADLSDGDSLAGQASVSMRLENWDFISRKIMENPWTGFGMDVTRSIKDFESETLYFATNTVMHPHNLALQLWIEFGLPGILLVLGFFGFLLQRLLQLPVKERRIPFTVFCVVLTFLMVSWSIWSGWLLAFIIYLSAITVLALRTNSGPATS